MEMDKNNSLMAKDETHVSLHLEMKKIWRMKAKGEAHASFYLKIEKEMMIKKKGEAYASLFTRTKKNKSLMARVKHMPHSTWKWLKRWRMKTKGEVCTSPTKKWRENCSLMVEGEEHASPKLGNGMIWRMKARVETHASSIIMMKNKMTLRKKWGTWSTLCMKVERKYIRELYKQKLKMKI
jgi:hypothetical protein